MRRQLAPYVRRVAFTSLLLVACGSRTGLFVDEEGFTNVTADAGPDGSRDGGRRDGSGFDGQPPDEDAPFDAPPPLDVVPPQDVFRTDCVDESQTYIYTITDTYDLQSFNPATNQFKTIGNGKIACPASPGATPFSMAVDRRGTAYVLFSDHNLFRVSTLTGACVATSYDPNQSGFKRFGMGFTTLDPFGPTEALFVAADTSWSDNTDKGLARISIPSFTVTKMGEFDSVGMDSAELTGTGDGRLFAFYNKASQAPDSYIGQVDPNTAHVIGERHFPDIALGNGWAFAFWGGDFYMFHAPTSVTTITRYRPSDESTVVVATSQAVIVGAGVSTCAPQQ